MYSKNKLKRTYVQTFVLFCDGALYCRGPQVGIRNSIRSNRTPTRASLTAPSSNPWCRTSFVFSAVLLLCVCVLFSGRCWQHDQVPRRSPAPVGPVALRAHVDHGGLEPAVVAGTLHRQLRVRQSSYKYAAARVRVDVIKASQSATGGWTSPCV